MAKVKKKTKAEERLELVAEAVGAGRKWKLETVDFSDPNRPKTCLEADFPILPINRIAGPEMASGAAKKPIYTWQKWWARRSSAVFRAVLIAAATKAPEETSEAAKMVWDAFYGNHQANDQFSKLRVADIFMGGGTTLVEGARLGMQMFGNDLNPVAAMVVRNELVDVKKEDVLSVLADIEESVASNVQQYYTCRCPRGHSGSWTNKLTGERYPEGFDALALSTEERRLLNYAGPQAIYALWVKHCICQSAECDHRTPVLGRPLVAEKTLSVKTWPRFKCSECSCKFDIEQHEVRIAPGAHFVVAESSSQFVSMDQGGEFKCPGCGKEFKDEKAKLEAKSSILGKATSKKVKLSLLVGPTWLHGEKSSDDGQVYGGSVTDDSDSTSAWNSKRSDSLVLIEVRGELPESIVCPSSGIEFFTDARGGTIPAKAEFACQEPTCGLQQKVLDATKASGKSPPVAMYAIQGYCPECDEAGIPYGGRFFDYPDPRNFDAAFTEWESRKNVDLEPYWPKGELPYGFMTHHNNGGIPNHGYTHWHTMFNPMQLLLHALFLKEISQRLPSQEASIALGVWQKYVQHDCMFCFWDSQQDCLAPHFSNNNYHPKLTPVQNNPFTKLGRGNWQSCVATYTESQDWKENPWDLVYAEPFRDIGIKSKTIKMPIGDAVANPSVSLRCGSASELETIASETFDLVVTDPPFGGLLHYSELADFYHVWVRLVLGGIQAERFGAEHTPKVLEAVTNRARNPDNPDGFYQRLLTECWKEASRILKPGGILAFTFHHSEDEPWIAVLESLFNAGFYLEAAYPIRSDDTKGEGSKPGTMGSQKIEYDIVHVCRKRIGEPSAVSWARLRRQITRDIRQIQEILEQHQQSGLGEADLQVIRRGKALEYFSRHYGKVYIERGREGEFTVRDALVGINQLLDDESDTSSDAPPVTAEPYTRQFLRLFTDKNKLERDQIQKYLRGTGVSPSEFLEREWCTEEKKVFTVADPLEWAKEWKGKPRRGMSRDFDQAYFLIGASYEDSGIRISDTLKSGSFIPHPAIDALLDWFARHGYDQDMKDAAARARQIYKRWENENAKEVQKQATLFDMEEDE